MATKKPDKKPELKPLTLLQEKFVAGVKMGKSHADAMKWAGFSPKYAGENASRVLKIPAVAAALAENRKQIQIVAGVDQEYLALGHKRNRDFDVRKLLDKKGKPLPIHKLDEETAKTIQGFEITTTEVAGVKTARYKYKLVDRKGSGDSLAKLLGLNEPEKKNITVEGGLELDEGITDDEQKALKLGFKFAIKKMAADAAISG